MHEPDLHITCRSCGGELGGQTLSSACRQCGSPVSESIDPQIVDGDLRVDSDITCMNCGYNLRTLPAGAVCPECGRHIADYLRPDYLRYMPASWLKRHHTSLSELLRASVFLPLAVACYALELVVPDSASVPLRVALGLPMLILLPLAAGGLVTIVGDQVPKHHDSVRFPRPQTAKALSVGCSIMIVIGVLICSLLLPPALSAVSWTVCFLVMLVLSIVFVCLPWHLQWMALRAADPGLAAKCRQLRLLGVLLVAGLFCLLVFAFSSSTGLIPTAISFAFKLLGGLLTLIWLVGTVLAIAVLRRLRKHFREAMAPGASRIEN